MRKRLFFHGLLAAGCLCGSWAKEAVSVIAEVTESVRPFLESGDVAGIVTLSGDREKTLHLAADGWADIGNKKAMSADALFWIASMTKPVTGIAVTMLAEEGKLAFTDPVSKYLPEFAELKDAGGKNVTITIAQCLSHTSGLQDFPPGGDAEIESLAELTAEIAKRPVKFPPGSQWAYCQTGISAAARVVEVVSGKGFPEFLEERLFGPLGMKDTAFYLSAEQAGRLAVSYDKADGKLKPVAPFILNGKSPTDKNRYPRASGGLFSTAGDYARFAKMILRGGELDGRRYLKEESIKEMTKSWTGELKAGFVPGSGYGLGWIHVREPLASPVTSMLSAGSFGHGGAYGTQAWIDPVKGRYYVMMIQRAGLGNGDMSDIRRVFQEAAAK